MAATAPAVPDRAEPSGVMSRIGITTTVRSVGMCAFFPHGRYSQRRTPMRRRIRKFPVRHRRRPRDTICTHRNIRRAAGSQRTVSWEVFEGCSQTKRPQPFETRHRKVAARVANGYPEVCLVSLLVAAASWVVSQDSDGGLVPEGAVKVARSAPRRGLTLTASVSAQWMKVWRLAGPWWHGQLGKSAVLDPRAHYLRVVVPFLWVDFGGAEQVRTWKSDAMRQLVHCRLP